MRGPGRLASAVLVGALCLAAASARACPFCAGGEAGSTGLSLLVVSLLLVPFALAGLVIWQVRRLAEPLFEEGAPSDPAGEPAGR